ncbi:MAG: dTMP kinase [Archaeoglobaceae archaeon]|nr:dTMP kinase [Archaeoglobaceae archaeon]MDW8118266.1 dTMP kinase [Archaeoglobaceae archaeon]
MKKGFLIAIEGIDGSGKSVIANELVKFLSSLGHDAILLKEPSDSIYGQKIKKAEERLPPEEELRLFLLDRELDVKERILPALEKGKIVVMDRYYYSNVAYQSVRGIEAKKILELNEKIAPKPDLVIILDLSAESAIKRILLRGKLTVFESKEDLEKVRENFLKMADEKSIVINAEKPLEDVKKEVFEIVKKSLNSYYLSRS